MRHLRSLTSSQEMSLTSPQSPFQSFHITLASSEYWTRIGSWTICDVTNRACGPRLSKLQQQVTLLRMIVNCCVSQVVTYWHFGSVAPLQHHPKSSVLNDLWMRLHYQHVLCYKIRISARIVLQSEAQTFKRWTLKDVLRSSSLSGGEDGCWHYRDERIHVFSHIK